MFALITELLDVNIACSLKIIEAEGIPWINASCASSNRSPKAYISVCINPTVGWLIDAQDM